MAATEERSRVIIDELVLEWASTPKPWPPIPIEGPVVADLSTKWTDGRVYFKLLIAGVPPPGLTFRRDGRLNIVLLDGNGFAQMTHRVELSELSELQDDSEESVTYQWLGDELLERKTYVGIDSWMINLQGVYFPK